MQPTYYKGEKIEFDVRFGSHPRYRIGARATHRTSQYLGLGATKKEAFEDLKKSADRIDAAGNWHQIPIVKASHWIQRL